MRLLFLTPEIPHPPASGGAIKTHSILTYLKDKHEIDILAFRRRSLTGEQVLWSTQFGRVQTVPLDRGRNPLNLILSYVDGLPLNIERNRSDRMRELVLEYFRTDGYEAVFVDHWLMAQYLPRRFRGLTVLHEHNAEHILWRRQAQREVNPLMRTLVQLESRRVRGYESAILSRFDAVFAVSEADRQALIRIGADSARTLVLPNLPDPSLLDQPPLSFEHTEPIILYFGTLSWQPNIEGLERLIHEVLPLVRQRLPGVRLVLAGRGAPEHLQALAEKTDGADFLGPVDDAEPLFRRARVSIEVSRSGGGTRLKVLNALARGLPVVVSPEGAEGLDVVPGRDLLVAEDPQSIAEAVARLMTDAALWRSLSEAGRDLVRERYQATSAYRVLDEVLAGATISG